MTDVTSTRWTRARRHGEPVRMLPAEAYTSAEVLAWERRHLFAGSWTCLGRVDDLFPPTSEPSPSARSWSATSRACWCATGRAVRMFANTCRHRGHELLPEDGTSPARSIMLPVPRVDLRPSGAR